MNSDGPGIGGERMSVNERSSVEALVASVLKQEGARTIEELVAALPTAGWAAVFLAVDGLSRSGIVTVRPCGRAAYRVSMKQAGV